MTTTYKNTMTGRVVRFADPVEPMERSQRWERLYEAEPEREPEPLVFEPGEHTVGDVNEHLAAADADERTRVLLAEIAGKGRRGVVEGPHAE